MRNQIIYWPVYSYPGTNKVTNEVSHTFIHRTLWSCIPKDLLLLLTNNYLECTWHSVIDTLSIPKRKTYEINTKNSGSDVFLRSNQIWEIFLQQSVILEIWFSSCLILISWLPSKRSKEREWSEDCLQTLHSGRENLRYHIYLINENIDISYIYKYYHNTHLN